MTCAPRRNLFPFARNVGSGFARQLKIGIAIKRKAGSGFARQLKTDRPVEGVWGGGVPPAVFFFLLPGTLAQASPAS